MTEKKLLEPWGMEVTGIAYSLSGNKAADIDKLLSKSLVEEALLKAAIKKLEAVMDDDQSLPEEIEVAAAEVQKYQGVSVSYKAPLNIIHKDNQKLGKDELPIPVIPQHFIMGAFRDTASQSFADQYQLATLKDRKNRVGKEHLRKYIQITPFHIFMFRDEKMEKMIESSDIFIEGQQPTPGAAGFARYEVITGPIYFKFNMIFQPQGKFPALADRNLVCMCLSQSTYRGLGGRRSANYGQWEIISAKEIDFKKPFEIMKGGKDSEGDTTSESRTEQKVSKVS
jgi:hypothetical protein